MGTILTSYGDAGYHHEGYAERLIPTGEYSGGQCSAQYPADAHVAFVAACSCGWRGSTEHPSGDEGEQLALAEWEHTHARPVLARAQHAELERLQAQLRDLAATDLTALRSPRERAELLANTQGALARASLLAQRLYEQAWQQAEQP